MSNRVATLPLSLAHPFTKAVIRMSHPPPDFKRDVRQGSRHATNHTMGTDEKPRRTRDRTFLWTSTTVIGESNVNQRTSEWVTQSQTQFHAGSCPRRSRS
jgi:hypothetical protein